MKRLRLAFAVMVCKFLIVVGKLMGTKSSSAPGRIALKLCPDALRLLAPKIKRKIICVLGTNGKTTTNNMINTLLTESGNITVCNTVGANMFDGVATAFINAAGMFGSLNADYAVLEIDEASAKIVFDHLNPHIIVITNLFRDQMDRYGEITETLEQLKIAVKKAPQATLVLNGDDPMCASFVKSVENPHVIYGVSEETNQPKTETKEGRTCMFCGEELSYNFYHYNQLGDFFCTGCDFKRPEPDFSATNVWLNPTLSFTLNEKLEVKTPLLGFYNLYNVLAAISVAETLKLPISNYTQIFADYETQTARMEEFDLGKPVILNLAKNPAGFNQAIATLKNDPRKKAVVVGINDMPSDGIDISWLYDVDFELLSDCVAHGASGKRCHDMALRWYYADVEDVNVNENPVPLALEFLKTDCEVIYLLVNYTLIFDAKKELLLAEKKAGNAKKRN
ncbi:MAG: DUF1727 domain-containing protein [Ruminococcaceae bacterium]|nr:DUF1727 domain-containing protein [Oscillospiraceae bacterium]